MGRYGLGWLCFLSAHGFIRFYIKRWCFYNDVKRKNLKVYARNIALLHLMVSGGTWFIPQDTTGWSRPEAEAARTCF